MPRFWIAKTSKMITSFKQTYIDALKHYYFVGGMPEAVQSFTENKDFNEVREIQKRILAAYEQDFSKHAPNEIVPRLRMLWNSIPSQLAKENKKFITASCVKVHVQKTTKPPFYGSVTVALFIR